MTMYKDVCAGGWQANARIFEMNSNQTIMGGKAAIMYRVSLRACYYGAQAVCGISFQKLPTPYPNVCAMTWLLGRSCELWFGVIIPSCGMYWISIKKKVLSVIVLNDSAREESKVPGPG